MRKGFEGISDFIFMEDPIEKADIILVPGASQRYQMEKAAELYHQGYADYILPSGRFNHKIPEHKSESHFLRDIAIQLGVPEEAILLEEYAAHTFENAQFSHELCKEKNIDVKKAIIVCKNFHSRRAYLTYKISFPIGTEFIVQPVMDKRGLTKDNWVESDEHRRLIMGEVNKIGLYFKDNLDVLVEDEQ